MSLTQSLNHMPNYYTITVYLHALTIMVLTTPQAQTPHFAMTVVE